MSILQQIRQKLLDARLEAAKIEEVMILVQQYGAAWANRDIVAIVGTKPA